MGETSVNLRVDVRVATERDASELLRFLLALHSERLPTVFTPTAKPTLEGEREFIRKLEESPNSVLLVADVAGEIVGVLDAHGKSRPQQSHCAELGMSVASTHRRRGIGTQLLSAVIDWAARSGIRRLELEVFSNNVAAIQLYESRGFTREGVKKRAVVVHREDIDVISMAWSSA